MSTATPGEQRREQSKETLSAAEFTAMLRHVIGFREQVVVADPLQQAVDQITSNPNLSQSRLLARILIALVRGGGSFRRAETTALDASTHALVICLLDLRREGARPRQDWIEATRVVEAAYA